MASVMQCESCGDPVDPQSGYRMVTGFERIKRGQGGTNAIRLREVTERFRCRWCIEKQGKGIAVGQESLL